MLDVAKNPFSETLKKFIEEFKGIKWHFPYILQSIHSLICLLLFVVLLILYVTIGFISQISNTFWDYLYGLGQKLSYSSPIQSLFYIISMTLYFILFLPFFIFQMPFWFSGWAISKIGFKLYITLLILFSTSSILYYYNPNIAQDSLNKLSYFHDSIKTEYFSSDSLNSSPTEEIKLVNEASIK